VSELLASTIRGQKLGALSYADGTSAPKYFGSGLPFEDDGSIAVEVDGAIDHYHQGLPFTADGRLAVTLSGPPTRFGGGAAPFSASGQLVLGSDSSHYSGGIPFTATSAISSTAGAPPPPLNQRYITMLDGQSKFWRRNAEWTSGAAGASVDTLFFPNDISRSSRQYVTDDSENNPDRLYVSLEPNTGNISWDSSITVTSAKLNGQTITRNSTPPEQSKINRVELTTSTQVGFGKLGSKNDGADFFDGAVFSVDVVDQSSASNSFSHPLDTNLPYDLPAGMTLGPELPASTRDFSFGGPWDNGTFTRSNTIGEWSTDAGGIGPRTDVDSLLSSDFWLISWSGLVDSDIYINLDGSLSLVSAAPSGTQVVSIGSATTTAQLYLRAANAGVKTLSALSLSSIPNSALIFENGSIDQSDRLLVTKNAAIGFWGEDKWSEAIKSVTGQVTVPTDDSITIDEVGGTLAGVAIDAPAAPIRVTGDCDLISGQVDISVIPALAGVAASITQSGPFSFDLDSQGALGFKRAFSGGAQAVITNIKVELRYDYATGAQPATSPYSPEYSSEYR
tara:strand:- start:35 stop:1723 length:1689 start_codon:yes stop_codon:yes gene_type:complete